MKATKSLTYAVKNTLVSPTLLLRSYSNPSPSLCRCGSCAHEDVYINILPDVLFTAKPGRLAAAINNLIESICEQHISCCSSVYYTDNRMSRIISQTTDEQCWWKDLVCVQSDVIESLTPFTLALRALVNFEDFYTRKQTNSLTEIINVCRSCDHKNKPNYKANRLKFSVGLCSYLNCIDMFYWSPGSRELAFEFVLAWSKLLIDEQANNKLSVQGVCCNLAPQTLGVIENCSEYLSMGRLSSNASRFIQIEPEQPIFSDETDPTMSKRSVEKYTTKEIVVVKDPETISSENNPINNISRHKSITLIIITGDDEDCVFAKKLINNNDELHKLNKVWKSVVDKQMESVTTIVYRIDESLDKVIQSINKVWGDYKCTVCLENNHYLCTK
ncbi:unnamed protein product [Heterobilharzia americana]|nr:unnamed protein product [Heterobilharzia americana]